MSIGQIFQNVTDPVFVGWAIPVFGGILVSAVIEMWQQRDHDGLEEAAE